MMPLFCLALSLSQPLDVALPALPPGVEGVSPGAELAYGSTKLAQAMDLVSARRWGALVGLLLMAAAAVFLRLFVWSKELRERLRDYMPEVLVGVSMAGYVGLALSVLPAGAQVGDWWAVAGPALVTGAVAIGGWELLTKRLVGHWLPKGIALAKALWAKLPWSS